MSRMTEAVTAALDARKDPDPRDGAAAALATTYAGLMDEAVPAGKYRRALAALEWVVRAAATEDENGNDVAEAFTVVVQALAEHSVASDLGPKLAAILDKLGLTTTARGKAEGGGVKDEPEDPLAKLRAERAARLGARVSG